MLVTTDYATKYIKACALCGNLKPETTYFFSDCFLTNNCRLFYTLSYQGTLFVNAMIINLVNCFLTQCTKFILF